MLVLILQISILSFIIIYIFHKLFLYLTNIFTTTKVKNYQPSKTYQSILNTLHERQKTEYKIYPNEKISLSDETINEHTTPISDFDINITPNSNENISMKDELQMYMKQSLE